MKSTAFTLILGLVAGLFGGYLIASVANQSLDLSDHTVEPGPAHKGEFSDYSRERLIDELEKQKKENRDQAKLAREKDERIQELLKNQPEQPPVDEGKPATTKEPTPKTDGKNKLSSAEIATRAAKYKAEFQTAFAAGDKQKVVDALRFMRELGPEAWGDMVELLNMLSADRNGENRLDLGMHDYMNIWGRDEEMFTFMLNQPNAATEVKIGAIMGLGFHSRDGNTETLRQALANETDPEVIGAIARALSHRDNGGPDMVPDLINALKANSSNNATRSLLSALGEIDTPESISTLDYYSNYGATEEIRLAAERAYVRLNPPEDGISISRMHGSNPLAKAGLEEDDIIVSYNGQPVASSKSLKDLSAAYPQNQTTTIEYYRGRKKYTAQINGGQIDAWTRTVKKKQ